MRPSRGRRKLCALFAVAACVILVSGCGQQPSDISESAAFDLQGTVNQVIASVNDNHLTDALASLNDMQTRLIQSTASGDVGSERAATIQTAIDRVKNDLLAAISRPSSESSG